MAAVERPGRGREWQHRGLTEALRALRLAKREPGDGDRPPPSVLPGRKTKPLPGQLDLSGRESGRRSSPGELLAPLTEHGEPYELRCERCGATGAGVGFVENGEPSRLCPRCRATDGGHVAA